MKTAYFVGLTMAIVAGYYATLVDAGFLFLIVAPLAGGMCGRLIYVGPSCFPSWTGAYFVEAFLASVVGIFLSLTPLLVHSFRGEYSEWFHGSPWTSIVITSVITLGVFTVSFLVCRFCPDWPRKR